MDMPLQRNSEIIELIAQNPDRWMISRVDTASPPRLRICATRRKRSDFSIRAACIVGLLDPPSLRQGNEIRLLEPDSSGALSDPSAEPVGGLDVRRGGAHL